MRRFTCAASILLVGVSVAACGSPSRSGSAEDDLRSPSTREALVELDQIAEAIRAYYGPLEYKKERFGFDLDREVAKAKTQLRSATTMTEGDRVRPVIELLAKLKDGHVSYSYPLPADTSARLSLPLSVTPVEGSYVVSRITPQLPAGIALGDILISVDGLTTAKLEGMLLPLTEIGTLASSRHMVGRGMTTRAFYLPSELQPKQAAAHLVFQKADGAPYKVDVEWRTTKGGLEAQVLPPVAPAVPAPSSTLPEGAAFSGRVAYLLKDSSAGEGESLKEFGRSIPYYLTAAVREKLGVVEVGPLPQTLTSLGVTVPPGDELADDASRFVWFRAYKYVYGGKNVLLVRIPSFQAPRGNYAENVAWLAALLKDNLATPSGSPTSPVAVSLAETPADALVVDVTHNPGGSVAYLQGLASLLTTKPIPNFVQANRADRTWISRFLSAANGSNGDAQPLWLGRMRAVEAAYDTGNWLSPFMPLTGPTQNTNAATNAVRDAGSEMLAPHPLVQWNKPVLVLHDELSGSAGDAFPALLQNGGVAKTFGAQTMGLGGTVESVLTLPYSRAELRLTRGLNAPFQPPGTSRPVQLIENNGVTPNIPYTTTIADFRAGFVGFATAFSDAAARATRTE